MKHILMFVFLLAVWMLWSGHYSLDHTLVFAFGLLSCAFVTYLVWRMDIVDEEGHPLHKAVQLWVYIPWLIWEIVKANLDVTKRILNPRLPIRPCMVRVKALQKTDLGRVIYANSITLTPGTVSVSVVGNDILVHALTKEAGDDVVEGNMNRRVATLEG